MRRNNTSRLLVVVVLTLTVVAISSQSVMAATTIAAVPIIATPYNFSDAAFAATWNRADAPVIAQATTAKRGFTWGPPILAASDTTLEPYNGTSRKVQYFDKARMEINDPNGDSNSLFYVTTGLLVKELVTGRLQTGDNQFTQLTPSTSQVAGDPNGNGANSIAPTYASFAKVGTFSGTENWATNQVGNFINTQIDREGNVTITPKAPEQLHLTAYDSYTKHNIADVFVNFANQTSLIWNGNSYTTGSVFYGNPVYVLGRPVTEPYWTKAVVAGIERDVLVQLFERRVLTYTPSNPDSFKVEMGNVGQHYYLWRYNSANPIKQTLTNLTTPANLTPAILQQAATNLNPAVILNDPTYPDVAQDNLLTQLTITTNPDQIITIQGDLAGGLFLLKFPTDWNGKLILYNHGYLPVGKYDSSNLIPPDTNANTLMNTALSQKFGYGYTNYSKPLGYSVKAGIESTQLLKSLIQSVLPVKQIFLLGESMGADVTLGLLEKFPADYSGAITTCGVMAGWSQEISYILDFRLVYDYFTGRLGSPVALPDAGHLLEGIDVANYGQAVVDSVQTLFSKAATNSAYAQAITQIANVTGVSADQMSFVNPLAFYYGSVPDYLNTANGNSYSNQNKVYQGSLDDAALNSGIQRLTANSEAIAYLNAWYMPIGKFNAKLISIHNLIDPIVPYQTESIFQNLVAQNGNLQNLVEQVVNARSVDTANPMKGGPTHCYFNSSQYNYAWNELMAWVTQNIRPKDGANITEKQ